MDQSLIPSRDSLRRTTLPKAEHTQHGCIYIHCNVLAVVCIKNLS